MTFNKTQGEYGVNANREIEELYGETNIVSSQE